MFMTYIKVKDDRIIELYQVDIFRAYLSPKPHI